MGPFAGSRESRAGACSAPSSPTTPEGDQQLTRHLQRGSKCKLLTHFRLM